MITIPSPEILASTRAIFTAKGYDVRFIVRDGSVGLQVLNTLFLQTLVYEHTGDPCVLLLNQSRYRPAVAQRVPGS